MRKQLKRRLEDRPNSPIDEAVIAVEDDDVWSPRFWARVGLVQSATMKKVEALLRFLYNPFIAFIGLAAFLWGVALATRTSSYPSAFSLLSFAQVVFVLLAVAAYSFIHEFGHAVACRRVGAPAGAIGVGLYFFVPLFYTRGRDVERLSSFQRVIVDSGGLYFQALAVLPLLFAMFFWKPLYPYVCTLAWIGISVIVIGLNPILKLDGYRLYRDISAAPNMREQKWLWRILYASIAALSVVGATLLIVKAAAFVRGLLPVLSDGALQLVVGLKTRNFRVAGEGFEIIASAVAFLSLLALTIPLGFRHLTSRRATNSPASMNVGWRYEEAAHEVAEE